MYPQLNIENLKGPKAIIETDHGNIEVKLFEKIAPKATENFIKLSESGYYNGVIFHRVIDDFMIQGGDPTQTGAGGESIFNEPFEDEFSDKVFNLRGALSMANAGPNTNGSQFFIVQNKNVPQSMLDQLKEADYPDEIIEAYKKGGTPWLDGHHTVFGQVSLGMDVVDKIAALKTDMTDKPLKDVVIKKVTIKG